VLQVQQGTGVELIKHETKMKCKQNDTKCEWGVIMFYTFYNLKLREEAQLTSDMLKISWKCDLNIIGNRRHRKFSL